MMVPTVLVDTSVQDPGSDSPAFRRSFPAALEVFQGHYPGFPIVPGVLLIEACAAAVGKVHGGAGHWTGVRSARFLMPVRPNAEVVITVMPVRGKNRGSDYKCVVATGHDAVCTATIVYSEQYSSVEQLRPTEWAGDAFAGDIKKILPHRNPILLIDRVDSLLPGKSIVARKAVSANEIFHRDLPTTDAFPQSLLVESWCQSAGVLVSTETPNPDVLAGNVMLFGGMRGVEFHDRVGPGDVLVHHAHVERVVDDTAVMTGHTVVDGEAVMTVGSITLARRPAGELTGH